MSKVFEALRRLEKDSNGISADFGGEVQAIFSEPVVTSAAPENVIPVAVPSEPIASGFRSLPVRVSVESPLIPFMPAEQSHQRAGEQYRIIRTKIVQHPRSPRVMVVSSVDSGDGKTTSSINVAAALALKSEVNVLLVDGDLRRGKIGTLLGLPETPGLTDVLAGTCSPEEAIVQAEQFPNLHILAAGTRQANPTELLDSPRWRALVQQFRKRFNYVILDTPPIGYLADYDLVQAVSDGVLVVARMDYTKRSRCLKALKSIPEERLIGVILNCVDEWFLGNKSRSYYSYAPDSKGEKPPAGLRVT